MGKRLLWLALLCAIFLIGAQAAFANTSGAIFTTMPDGSRVNANIYPSKNAVYLDGGPGIHAPAGAAGLDPGWYYFQVTDPSGKHLLSEDPIDCRRFRVSADGVIVEIGGGIYKGKPFAHKPGTDVDHADLGALTVQLMPYKDTPNPGGVYKVWATPVEKYDTAGGGFHGFIPAWSKTDNYKVKAKISQHLIVKKFNDHDADGIKDDDEPWIGCWPVAITTPLNVTGDHYTSVDLMAEPGTWCVEEGNKPCDDPEPWVQTALYIDTEKQTTASKACVTFTDTPDEVHEIWFGNVKPGCIKVEKFNDLDADGEQDEGELGVPGVWFKLTGYGAWGVLPEPIIKQTGPDGSVSFCDLLPGKYTLEEQTPEGWLPTTPTVVGDISVTAGAKVGPIKFGNVKPGCIEVRKFEDKDGDGVWDDDEPTADFEITVSGSGPWGTYGPVTKRTGKEGVAKFCDLYPGEYLVEELIDGEWFQTALYVDGVKLPTSPSVTVKVVSDTTTKVVFGNARPGCIEADKFYDKDGDGNWDGDELPLKGIKFVLTGGNLTAPVVGYTGEDGKVEFCGLYPGEYHLEEILPPDDCWYATTPMSYDIKVRSGEIEKRVFGNVCRDTGDFGTKGWWQNNNGNPLITDEDIAYLNSLDPYDDATEYWNTPFADRAEIAEFIVNNVSASPYRFQLSQQLAAFILNCRHYAGGIDSSIMVPGGTATTGRALIEGAIAAWQAGEDTGGVDWIGTLDGFNNCDAVWIMHAVPCEIPEGY